MSDRLPNETRYGRTKPANRNLFSSPSKIGVEENEVNTRDHTGRLKDISVLWFQLGPAKRLFVFTMIPRFTHFGTESIFFGKFFPDVVDHFWLPHSFLRICPELHEKPDDGVVLYCPIFFSVEANWLKASIPDTRPWLLFFAMEELISLIYRIQSSTCSFHLPIGVITFRLRVFYITTQSLPSWWMVFISSFLSPICLKEF